MPHATTSMYSGDGSSQAASTTAATTKGRMSSSTRTVLVVLISRGTKRSARNRRVRLRWTLSQTSFAPCLAARGLSSNARHDICLLAQTCRTRSERREVTRARRDTRSLLRLQSASTRPHCLPLGTGDPVTRLAPTTAPQTQKVWPRRCLADDQLWHHLTRGCSCSSCCYACPRCASALWNSFAVFGANVFKCNVLSKILSVFLGPLVYNYIIMQ